MKKIAILGLGLMGGSLGLAIKREGLVGCVHGYARREASRRIAVQRRAADLVSMQPEDAVDGADLVILCLPVLAIAGVLKSCRLRLKPGCIVTDVASTKSEIVAECEKILEGTGATFIGSHPMAGSEDSGIAAANEGLFNKAVVIVTQASNTKTKAARSAANDVEAFWKSIGTIVVKMTAEEHDRLVAMTSHLPHLVAAMLVDRVRSGGSKAKWLCGPGFRDATRIAAGSEEIWHDIVKTNHVHVGRELEAMSDQLSRLSKMVKRGDFAQLRKLLAENRKARREFEAFFSARGSRA